MLEGFLDDATLDRVLRSAIRGSENSRGLEMEKFRMDPITGVLSASGLQEYAQAHLPDSPLEVSRLIVSVDLKNHDELQGIVGHAAVDHALCQIAGQLWSAWGIAPCQRKMGSKRCGYASARCLSSRFLIWLCRDWAAQPRR